QVFQIGQRGEVVCATRRASVYLSLGCSGIKTFQADFGGAVFVVIAFHAGHAHGADDVEAFLGVGVITHDVAKAGVMGAFLGFGVFQNHLQRLQIGVD